MKTLNGKTLAEWLQAEAGAEVDAVAHWLATGDDLRVHNGKQFYQALGDMGFAYPMFLQTGIMSVTGALEPAWGKLRKHFGECCRFSVVTAYDEREGRGYALALETAVAAYRRTAPAYSQDTPEGWWAMRGLKRELTAKHAFRIAAWSENDNTAMAEVWGNGFLKVWGIAETLPLAVTRAAIAALWNENEGRAE